MRRSIAIAAAVLAASTLAAKAAWTVLTLPDTTSGATSSMGHLADGRFVYGHNGALLQQNSFGASPATKPYTNAPAGDYAFVTAGHIARYNTGTASYDGANTGTAFTTRNTTITSPYAGVATSAGGLLMTGAVGFGSSGVFHLSAAGTFTTLVNGFSPWSGGIALNPNATGAAAYAFVAFAGPDGNNNNIYSFSRDQIDGAIVGSALSLVDATLVGNLTDTSSLAYDPVQNRLYGAGYNEPGTIHILDLDTNVTGKLTLPGVATNTSVMTFTDGGTSYVGWLSIDGWSGGSHVTYGYDAASLVAIPEPGTALVLTVVLGVAVLRRTRIAA